MPTAGAASPDGWISQAHKRCDIITLSDGGTAVDGTHARWRAARTLPVREKYI
jgi:hypothetical protein